MQGVFLRSFLSLVLAPLIRCYMLMGAHIQSHVLVKCYMLTQCIYHASMFLRNEEIRYVATGFKYIVCGGTER